MGFLSAEVADERITAALDAIDAAHEIVRQTSSDVVGNGFRVEVAERLETQDRTNRGLMYRFFGEIAKPPDGAGFIPSVRTMLWARLHITPKKSPAASSWQHGSAAPFAHGRPDTTTVAAARRCGASPRLRRRPHPRRVPSPRRATQQCRTRRTRPS